MSWHLLIRCICTLTSVNQKLVTWKRGAADPFRESSGGEAAVICSRGSGAEGSGSGTAGLFPGGVVVMANVLDSFEAGFGMEFPTSGPCRDYKSYPIAL